MLAELLADIERVADRAEAAGLHQLSIGLLAVTAATIRGLGDEALEALGPVIAAAARRSAVWLESALSNQHNGEPS